MTTTTHRAAANHKIAYLPARPASAAMAGVDLAPNIARQRVTIEGWRPGWVTAEGSEAYMTELAPLLGMSLVDPVSVSRSPAYGEAAWGHWDFSGGELMAWDEKIAGDAWGFFTMEVYTCKPFWAYRAAEWTRAWWRMRCPPAYPDGWGLPGRPAAAMVWYEVLPHLSAAGPRRMAA